MEKIKQLFDMGALCVPGSPINKLPIMAYQVWRNETPSNYMELWDGKEGHHIHVLCGTGDVYALDLDAKNDPGADIVMFEMECSHVLDKLYIEETASGGKHYFFRYNKTIHTSNLAFSPDKKPFIELKGNGALCRIAPSPGIKQLTVSDIPYISETQLNEIIEIAERYTKYIPPVQDKYEATKRVSTNTSPGDDYSDNASPEEVLSLLEENGWVIVKRNPQRALLRRPLARSKSHDADLSIVHRTFKCYSSSDTTFVTDKAYSFFQVYAILKHGGDYSAAAKELRSDGFGDTATPQTQVYTSLDEAADEEDVADEIDILLATNRQTLTNKPKNPSFILRFAENHTNKLSNRRIYDIGVGGSLMMALGEAGSRKTSAITAICASAITGKETAGWIASIKGPKLFFDTEQPEIWAYETARKICIQANLADLPDDFFYYRLRSAKDPIKRRQAIARAVAQHPGAGLIVIDGLKDLAKDFVNDNSEASNIMEDLMGLASGSGNEALVIAVLHVNPGTDKARGHLGTEAINKADIAIKVAANDEGDYSSISFLKTRGSIRPRAQDFLVADDNLLYYGPTKPYFNHNIGKLHEKEEQFPGKESTPPPAFNRSDEDVPF